MVDPPLTMWAGLERHPLKIYVDADACPVKQETVRVADRHRLEAVFVSNMAMRLPEGFAVTRIVVEEGPDAADDWIAEAIGPADVAVTWDIPLADRCLKKGAVVLKPTGQEFTGASIGMALAMRDLSAHLRETGGQTHHAAFSKRDRSQFLQALENLIQKQKRL